MLCFCIKKFLIFQKKHRSFSFKKAHFVLGVATAATVCSVLKVMQTKGKPIFTYSYLHCTNTLHAIYVLYYFQLKNVLLKIKGQINWRPGQVKL